MKLLDQTTALASGVFVRHKTDGSELETIGATYVLRKTDGEWKIAVMTRHPPAPMSFERIERRPLGLMIFSLRSWVMIADSAQQDAHRRAYVPEGSAFGGREVQSSVCGPRTPSRLPPFVGNWLRVAKEVNIDWLIRSLPDDADLRACSLDRGSIQHYRVLPAVRKSHLDRETRASRLPNWPHECELHKAGSLPKKNARKAAYRLRKFRGKALVQRIGNTRRYRVRRPGIQTLAALLLLRAKVLKPVLAGVCRPKRGRPPKDIHPLDVHYQNLQREMLATLQDLKLAA